MTSYAELHCHSAFSLLDGASTPEALVERAAQLGIEALALTDHDDLGGAVRFSQAARRAGLEAIIGAELTLADRSRVTLDGTPGAPNKRASPPSPPLPPCTPTHITLLARTAEGYANLSELISRARNSAGIGQGSWGGDREARLRGRPRVTWNDLAERAGGLLALTGCPQGELARRVRAGDMEGALALLDYLREIYSGYVAVEVWDHALPEERQLVEQLFELADHRRMVAVVTNDVHYATPSGRIVHDVLTCLRHKVTLDEAGTRLRPNGEWYLKPPSVVWQRWRHRPQVVDNTIALAAECSFRLADLSPAMPGFEAPYGVSVQKYLETLVWKGAVERYGAAGRAGSAVPGRGAAGSPQAPRHNTRPPGLTQHVRRQIRHELEVIEHLDLAGYFLIVWDIVRFARRKGILVQGRGSAANSCVCYCLGITAVDPIKFELLFERFLSEERGGAPDIDLDIEHEQREDVLQYVYKKYGRGRAGMVCEAITYRGKSAVRDAARVLGFSTDVADRLSGETDHQEAAEAANALEHRGLAACGLDPADSRVRALVHVVRGMDQLPRHRSIHTGGFVLTDGPLSRVVPIEPAAMKDRTVIQWDKDDLEFTGLIKIDLLGLGMLTCLAKSIRYIRETRGVPIDLAHLPPDDPEVYEMIQASDTVGVFQIESRAQMNSLPRIKPQNFYDLVVQVAIIRPGPIQGDMVHPYIRRRRGEEPVTFLHPSLEPILRRTLGVPLFQEQGMRVAVAMAGFTPGQADMLRRAMGFKRSQEAMAAIEPALRKGMTERGVSTDVQAYVVKYLTAFANYGFPESHAASFALLVYASAYLKKHYAPEFYCGLLNSQPMGFYTPGTLVHDARRHGVEVRPVDLARSLWDCTLEPPSRSGSAGGAAQPQSGDQTAAATTAPALRIGLRYVSGLGSKAQEKLEAAWASGGAFASVEDVVQRSGLGLPALKTLAGAGAFDTLWGPGRRSALWEVLGRLAEQPLAPVESRRRPKLREMKKVELVAADYMMTGLCTHGHPMEHLRDMLRANGVLSAEELKRAPRGSRVKVAGVVICRQRPGTAKGVLFITLEDETGFSNFIIYPDLFERSRRTVLRSPVLLIEGDVQNEEDAVNVMARRISAITPKAGAELVESHDFR
ncbi:MAG: error-prone DNA polymerase [Gemmatimonadota bacterium]